MEDHVLFRSLKGQASMAEKAFVQAWRQKSSENERRYRELGVVLEVAAGAEKLVESVPPSPFKVIHQAESMVPLEGTAARGRSRRRRSWLNVRSRWGVAAAAAVLALSVLVGGLQIHSMSPTGLEAEDFVTAAGEAATVTLRDGTVVRLGPQSRLRLNGGRGRDVSLWGRALFSVAKDPSRPFRVELTEGTVEALGTRFEVEARDGDLRVAVIEGRVALSARGLRTEVPAGEMRRVVGGATLPSVKIPDGAVDWVGNFLAFQDTPLTDAASEIGRLYDVQIEIADAGLVRQTITAWFSDQTLEQVMTIFCLVAQAQCTTSEEGGVITVKPGQRP